MAQIGLLKAFVKQLNDIIYLIIIYMTSWIIVHGKVYDVTSFLEDHPGNVRLALSLLYTYFAHIFRWEKSSLESGWNGRVETI